MDCNETLYVFFLLVLLLLPGVVGCRRGNNEQATFSPEDSTRIVREILGRRREIDDFFRYDSRSPFLNDTTIRFNSIRWYPPSLAFYFTSRLFRSAMPETVTVVGTKGDLRKELSVGYFIVTINGQEYRLRSYTSLGSRELSLWFTDSTTGNETYHVGRYLDIGEIRDDPNTLYVVNFNNAYNPYCAYSALYSCAIPRKEDHLSIAIRAGELVYK